MSPVISRHGRPDVLARLAPPAAGWVPQRPQPSLLGPARLRLVPSRRAVAGLGVVGLVAVLVAVLMLWRAQPSARAAPSVPSGPRVHRVAAQQPVAPASPAATSAASVVVQVVGAVRRPGLVWLPAGSRVADAVRAAGGLTGAARAASINLARPLVDGEQLLVQRRGRPPLVPAPGTVVGAASGAGSGAGAAGAPGPSAPVDLNTATLEQLDALPGIGPVLAQRILDWRTANGRFDTVDELSEVSGIGESHLADLRPLVSV